jgi:hypothetical protein
MEGLVNAINVAAAAVTVTVTVTVVTACAAPASRPNRVGMITNQPIPNLKQLKHDEKHTLTEVSGGIWVRKSFKLATFEAHN